MHIPIQFCISSEFCLSALATVGLPVLLGTSTLLLCSTSVPQAKVFSLLDVHQLIMAVEET
jgi:hypothetical protein